MTDEGDGTGFGAVAQGGTVIPGWDAGTVRDAVTTRNHGGPHPPLPGVERMGVDALAEDARTVSTRGLDAIVDIDPPG